MIKLCCENGCGDVHWRGCCWKEWWRVSIGRKNEVGLSERFRILTILAFGEESGKIRKHLSFIVGNGARVILWWILGAKMGFCCFLSGISFAIGRVKEARVTGYWLGGGCLFLES